VIAGYPVHDIRVTVHDGKHHAVDSKEVGVRVGGAEGDHRRLREGRGDRPRADRAHRNQCARQIHGDLTNDLSGKRGHVTGTDNGGRRPHHHQGPRTAIGTVGLPDAAEIRHRRAGSYSIDFSHYAPVPGHTQAQLVSKHKQPVEEGEQ